MPQITLPTITTDAVPEDAETFTGFEISGPMRTVPLSPKLRDTLLVLMSHRGQIVPANELLAKVWGSQQISLDVLQGTIYRLRKSFRDSGTLTDAIENIHGEGYRIRHEAVGVRPQIPGLRIDAHDTFDSTQGAEPGALLELKPLESP